MSYTKNRMTRIVLDKIENDKRLRAIDRDQWYQLIDLETLPQHAKFLLLNEDQETQNFIEQCFEKSDWFVTQFFHSLMMSMLKLFMATTSINGLLSRGSMFVFSVQQFGTLIDFEGNYNSIKMDSLLDLGAGDGAVTEKMELYFNEVYATEMSVTMQWRLKNKGYTKNILYINNFKFGSKTMCFGHSWYLANDMQFHWISLLMLIPLYKFNKTKINYGVIITLVLLLASLIATLFTLLSNPGFEMGIFSNTKPMDYLVNYYIKPWIRIPAFLIGILAGHFLYNYKLQKKSKIDWKLNGLCWTLSILVICFITYSSALNYTSYVLPREFHILYQIFHKPLWGLSICFIIFACNTSNGGFVRVIFKWPIWVFMSKLTYSTYLVHYFVVQYYPHTQLNYLTYTDLNFVWIFTSNVVFSYALGFVVTLLFEMPFHKLEQLLFK